MKDIFSLTITIDISGIDSSLGVEEIETRTRRLQAEVIDLDFVQEACLVREEDVPEGGKSALGGFVLGLLKTEISAKSIGALFSFLSSSFNGKPIEMVVKVSSGKEITLKAGSRKDFELAAQEARKFLDQS